jgi:mannose-6-phosphate isomerase-like protein (cupin superfamily)
MSKTTSAQIVSLIAAVKITFARREANDDVVAGEIAKVVSLLEPLPPLSYEFTRNSHAATRHIRAALQAGTAATAALRDVISPIIHFLPWRYSYPLRDDVPGLGQNIAFAEIIGPEAPFRSNSVCLGLTLIGPETLYPAHRHPAIELYYVVAGTASWTLDGVSHDQPPGTYILHPSQAIHAMQTHIEPLLAIYSWSGADVRTTSVYTNITQSGVTQPAISNLTNYSNHVRPI